MTKEELKEWDRLRREYSKEYSLSKSDWSELIRLNHLIMEVSHEIHNENMLSNK